MKEKAEEEIKIFEGNVEMIHQGEIEELSSAGEEEGRRREEEEAEEEE